MDLKIEKLVNLARNNTNIYEQESCYCKIGETLCKNPDYLSQNVGMKLFLSLFWRLNHDRR